MNNEQTLQRLRQLRLGAMADLHNRYLEDGKITNSTPEEYLAMLTEHQWEDRINRKIERLIKCSCFRDQANIMEVKYTPGRNLDKNNFIRLSTLEFLRRKENLILTGACGTGKSYLAQALGNEACLKEHSVLYANTARLLTTLKHSKVDGTYLKELIKISRTELLILDDFGLQAFDAHTREILLDITEERYNKASTIIVSQIPVSAWYDLIGEGTLADAILDRLINSSHRINLEGESLRKSKMKSINPL